MSNHCENQKVKQSLTGARSEVTTAIPHIELPGPPGKIPHLTIVWFLWLVLFIPRKSNEKFQLKHKGFKTININLRL